MSIIIVIIIVVVADVKSIDTKVVFIVFCNIHVAQLWDRYNDIL